MTFKILAASDLHENTPQVKKLAKAAQRQKADVIVLAGDLTYFDHDWKGMVGPFLEKRKMVVFVAGNHDSPATAELLSQKYGIKNLETYATIIDDVGFFGCGGGGANIGINFPTEQEIAEALEAGFRYVKDAKRKVMVTHVHPKGGKVEKLFGFRGSEAVTKAIRKFKPDIHIFGHVHEAEGTIETIGTTESICVGEHGKIIELSP